MINRFLRLSRSSAFFAFTHLSHHVNQLFAHDPIITLFFPSHHRTFRTNYIIWPTFFNALSNVSRASLFTSPPLYNFSVFHQSSPSPRSTIHHHSSVCLIFKHFLWLLALHTITSPLFTLRSETASGSSHLISSQLCSLSECHKSILNRRM